MKLIDIPFYEARENDMPVRTPEPGEAITWYALLDEEDDEYSLSS